MRAAQSFGADRERSAAATRIAVSVQEEDRLRDGGPGRVSATLATRSERRSGAQCCATPERGGRPTVPGKKACPAIVPLQLLLKI